MKRMSPEAAENVRYSVGPSFSFIFYAKFTYPIMKGQLAQVVERHISVKVASSNLVLFLLYFMKGEFL